MVTIQLRGVRELRSRVRELERAGLDGALADAMKAIAKDYTSRARGRAGARLAPAITGKATRKSASLTITPVAGAEDALIRFMGAKRRTGWYRAAQYRGSTTRQHPVWVGKTSDLYRIGPVLTDTDTAARILADHMERALRRAFSD